MFFLRKGKTKGLGGGESREEEERRKDFED